MDKNNQTIWEMAMENAKNEPKKSTKQKKVNLSKELLMTFSNQKSLISSKKVERFLVFIVFIGLTIFYVVKNIEEMHATEFIEVIGIWLAYGGYNSFMNFKDKKVEDTTPSEEEPS